MVVVPAATSVTAPLAATVATLVLLDSHVTVAPLMAVPPAATVAVNVPALVPL